MNPLTWTELPNKSGATLEARTGTWADLVARLRDAGTFPSKEMCPWVKGAAFGTKRTAKGSLRSNENVTAVFAIEGDYDGGVMQLDTAARLLEKSGVKAALYPSPSSTADNPRWRVIAPLSEQHAPDTRAALVARLNGVLGGILAGESFTLSQGFYFGATPGNGYRVATTFDDPNAGQCIDVLHDLDRGAIGKHGAPKEPKTDMDPFAALVNAETFRDLRSALTALRCDDRTQWVDVGLALKTLGEQGRALWLEWSQTSDKYDPKDAADKWESFTPTQTGYQSIFSKAQDSGWLNPKSHKPENSADFPDQLEQATANTQRYKLLGSADLHALPPLSWRVRGVLPAVGLAALYGPSASGKSFLALDMAAAIAEGSRWFDCRVVTAPVVYIVLEGEGGFKLRVSAWESHNHRALPSGLSIVLQSVTLTEPQDIKDVAAVIPPGAVVFIDTLNRAAPTADENSSKDMGQILEAAKALQTLIAGLVVLVHHTGKDTTKGLRGHSSLLAAMDAAIEVSRDVDNREWKVAKAKDGEDGNTRSFELQVKTLGADEYGDAVTSCVVQPCHSAIHTKPLSIGQRLGLDSLTAALTADLFGNSVHREVWRESFYGRHPAESQGTKQKAFTRAVAELQTLGCVCEVNGQFGLSDF